MYIDLYCDFIEAKEQLTKTSYDISTTETEIAKLNIEIRAAQYTDSIKLNTKDDKLLLMINLRDDLKNKLELLIEQEEELKNLVSKKSNEIKDILNKAIKTERLELFIFYNKYVLRNGKTLEDIKIMLNNEYQMATVWRISSMLNKSIANELKERKKK